MIASIESRDKASQQKPRLHPIVDDEDSASLCRGLCQSVARTVFGGDERIPEKAIDLTLYLPLCLIFHHKSEIYYQKCKKKKKKILSLIEMCWSLIKYRNVILFGINKVKGKGLSSLNIGLRIFATSILALE